MASLGFISEEDRKGLNIKHISQEYGPHET